MTALGELCWWRVIKEFQFETILFQVGVTRVFTKKELTDFIIVVFNDDYGKFNEHFELVPISL